MRDRVQGAQAVVKPPVLGSAEQHGAPGRALPVSPPSRGAREHRTYAAGQARTPAINWSISRGPCASTRRRQDTSAGQQTFR